VTKKNSWAIGLVAALLLAPAMNVAAAKAEEKPAAKAEPKVEAKAEAKPEVKAEPKAEPKAEEKPAETKADPDKAKEAKADEKGDGEKASKVHHKSPALAGFLGFIPGIAVHGAGHMYAGSWMKGLGLLAIEAASVGIIAANVSTIQADVDAISKTNNGVPTDLSVPYTKIGIITVSATAFLWSWFDDMAGAPIAVAEYNKIQDQGATARLQLAPRGDGAQLALSTQF
jgi:hypothetical protein